MMFEGSGSKGTRVIERKISVTDGQTDKAKTICLGGGDITRGLAVLCCIHLCNYTHKIELLVHIYLIIFVLRTCTFVWGSFFNVRLSQS